MKRMWWSLSHPVWSVLFSRLCLIIYVTYLKSLKFSLKLTSPSLLSLSVTSCAVITGQYVRFTVRIGGEVTLPCGNVTREQDKCDRTTWSFRRFTSASADLIRFGQVLETAKAKSDRLSVTENCSLVVRRVTVDDGGLYTCRQFESGKHEDTHVHLFVIISEYLHQVTVMKFLFRLSLTWTISPSSPVTEHQEADKVTLKCSVSAPGWCDQTLKWLYEDAYVDKHNKDMEISGFGCSVTVTFPSSFLKHHRSFICELTDTDSTAKEQFPFSRQSSGEITRSSRCLFWWTIMDGDDLTSCEK